MTKPKTQRKLLNFDAARYLTDDAAVAEYMTAVLETNDPDFLLVALGDVDHARGSGFGMVKVTGPAVPADFDVATLLTPNGATPAAAKRSRK